MLLNRSGGQRVSPATGKGSRLWLGHRGSQLPQNLLEDSPEASLKLLAKFAGLGFPSSARLDPGPRERETKSEGTERGNVDFISLPTPVFIN